MSGQTLPDTYLFYDGTVEYFGREHLPFALVAIFIAFLFIVLPILLLCVYPCRCFQRCLNYCNLRVPALHIFMDTFQGHFKDGTNGTRDCRYFAAMYLILRVVVYVSLVFSTWYSNYWYSMSSTLVFLLLLSVFRPFKVDRYNKLESAWMILLTLFFGIIAPFIASHTEIQTLTLPPFFFIFVAVPTVIPVSDWWH